MHNAMVGGKNFIRCLKLKYVIIIGLEKTVIHVGV